jgi:hemolysin activation/secretion protein
VVAVLAVLGTHAPTANAQARFGLDPTGRSGEAPPPLPEERPSVPSPLPEVSPLPPMPEEEAGRLPRAKVQVRKIKVTGNTVISAEELSTVSAPYENRELTSEDLETLRRELTMYYVKRGYINSGAIIPDQDVVEGVVTFRIIEGRLDHIEVTGNKWFRSSYLEKRVALGSGPPLNVLSLQERLLLLQQDPHIERINAELRPGVNAGESILDVAVAEKTPYHGWLRFNNYQSPTVGGERGQGELTHQNLLGYGDALDISYGRSDGIDPEVEATYTLPFTVYDTTLDLEYRRNDFSVVEQPFQDLDVESESEIYGVGVRQPCYRSLNQELDGVLTFERLWNQTYLLGEKFSFSLGPENGESVVTALRFGLEWTYRTPVQVWALRSRFSWGLDALDSTINNSSYPDSRFFCWLGQFQWARRMQLLHMQLIFRADLQLSRDPLLPLEQIAVGGRYSVRGYRENQMVRDNGFITSLEFRIPLVENKPWAESLQLAPFADFGRAWNEDLPVPSSDEFASIGSIGVGIRWAVAVPRPWALRPEVELYWGYPFRDIEAARWDLQDEGIHLQVSLAAF